MKDDLTLYSPLTAHPTATSRVGEASGVLSDETPLRSEHREFTGLVLNYPWRV